MSFKTVYEGIRDIMEGLELAEAKHVYNYESAAENEFGNTFILKSISGTIDDDMSEEIINKFHDAQVWQLQVGFNREETADVANRLLLHKKKESILSKIDNPANWCSFVRMLKYTEWEVVETDNYVVLQIELLILDTITHT
jgi:hypothetical protein